MPVADPIKEKHMALLVAAYRLILSWPEAELEDSAPTPTTQAATVDKRGQPNTEETK